MDEILKEFVAEATGMVEQLGSALAAMPPGGDSELFESAYRAVHTVRGASGFLALEDLEALTTRGELLLARLRDGVLEPTAERMDLLDRLHQELAVRLTALDSGAPAPAPNQALLSDLATAADA